MSDPTAIDVLFSLQRWFGMLLPAPWDIQPTRLESQQRPAGVVQPVGVVTDAGSAYVRLRSQPYEAFLWPLGVDNQPLQTRLEAERLREQVETALVKGLVTDDGYRSYSLRIPWFDYETLALNEDYPPGATPEGYLLIARNFSVDVRPDPEQEDLSTIVVAFTIDTERQGDTSRFEGQPLQEVLLQIRGQL